MKVEKRKILKSYDFHGLGFKVTIHNLRMIYVMGMWALDLRFNAFEDLMAANVALKRGRLTGNEARFLRQYSSLTREELAQYLGVTRQSVAGWEGRRDAVTRMALSSERVIRLRVVRSMKLPAGLFGAAYDFLMGSLEEDGKQQPYVMDANALGTPVRERVKALLEAPRPGAKTRKRAAAVAKFAPLR